ncbi:MAG: DUF2142 domain-containing protein [Candidatus Gracilibacteria bacterium]
MTNTGKIKYFLGFFLALGLLWSFLLPPFQGPDEAFHFSQIKLWEFSLLNGFQDSSEATTLCLEDLHLLSGHYRSNDVRANPLSSFAAPVELRHHSPDYFYDPSCKIFAKTPLYYILSVPLVLIPGFNVDAQFYVVRLFSLFCVVFSLFCIFKIASLLFKHSPQATLLPVLIALTPTFFIVNVSISYDSLINLLFIFCFWVSFSFILREGPFSSLRRFLAIAILVSLAGCFIKITGVFLPIFFALAFLFSKRVKFLYSFLFLLTFSSLALGKLLSILSLPSLTYLKLFSDPSYLYTFFIERWVLLFKGFWGGSGAGWIDVYIPPLFVYFFAIFTFIGLGMSVWKILKYKHDALILVYCFLTILFFELGSLIYNALYVSDLLQFGALQGRYYLVLLLPLFILILEGWRFLIPFRLNRFFYVSAILIFMFIHFFYLGSVFVPRFYF